MVPELEDCPGRAVVDRRSVRGMTVVTLAGELDIADFPLLGRQLRRLPDAPLPSVVVDLTQVAFMDCSVLRVLVSVHRRAQMQAGCLRIAAPQPEPLHLLRTSRLDQVFCLYDTLQAAVEPLCVRHLSTS